MFLDNLKKNIKLLNKNNYYCGFYFDKYKYYFLEVKNNKNNYLPTYHKIFDSFEFINEKGTFDLTKSISIFKKLFSHSHTDTIIISKLSDQKLEAGFVSALNIAGFKKVIIKKSNLKQILPVIIKTHKKYPQNFLEENKLNVYFTSEKIYFILTKNNQIISTTIFNSNILEYDFLKNFLKKHQLYKPEVYISGKIELNLENIKEMFYLVGLKTHITNIWQNLTDTQRFIPRIFFLESHQYIPVIALISSHLKPLSTIPKEEINKKENISQKETEKEETETEKNIDLEKISSFQKKKIKEEKKIVKEKEIHKEDKNKVELKEKIKTTQNTEKIKNIFWKNKIPFFDFLDKKINYLNFLDKKIIFSNSSNILENKKTENKKTEIKNKNKEIVSLPKNKKKLFLPKFKKKIFLPKIKKLTKIKVFKAGKVFYLEKNKIEKPNISKPENKTKEKVKKTDQEKHNINNKTEENNKNNSLTLKNKIKNWIKKLENFWDQEIF